MASFALNGCGQSNEREGKRPNVILISIDTLRADRLHGYGYERETSPFLDELMASGTSFSTTISQSPWTLPSHISIFTGLYPHTHGVTEDTLALNEQVATLPVLMKEQGYATGGFASAEYLSGKHGFARGFDTYVQKRGILAPVVCEEALKWLIQAKSERYFLFLHFYDVHPNYEPSEEFLKMFEPSYGGNIKGTIETLLRVLDGDLKLTEEDMQHLEALYDAEIRQLDQQLRVFFSFLREKSFLDNTIVIITADHGEEFFEHGSVLHSRTLYDEIIKVPLIIAGPQIPAGKTVSEQVELIDVMPTILDICGAGVPGTINGRSLLPLLDGNPDGKIRHAFAESDKDNEAHNIKRAIRSSRYKLYYDTHTGKQELYDVVRDPKEQVNIIDSSPEIGADLRKQLDAWMATRQGNPRRVTLSEDEKQELKSLGYLR